MPRSRRRLLILGILVLGVFVAAGAALARRGKQAAAEEDGPMAPELSGAVAWLNTDHPITISELRGRVVILDFWTYGCINCMHVLPVLRQLEAAHAGQPLDVIGVHSAKFANEQAPDRVRAAVERYGITHPVAVDSRMAIWESYGVRAWPTLVVIRPDGRVAGQIPGEASFTQLDGIVKELLAEGRQRGTLAAGPAIPPRPQVLATGELAYPGKVIAAPDGRLFISDSRHHRVLVTAPDGRILDQIGSGAQGRKDGPFERAELDDPQGMTLAADTLYLADARGYAVLRIDLKGRTVATLAGTGKLGQEPLGAPVDAATTSIRSPWDVALDREGGGKRLFIAMAGSHQIGAIDLEHGTLERFAGSGREAIRDGDAEEAAFAQPSGLSLSPDGKTLYVADSESSGVRAIDLSTRRTRTLLGTGLFDWGDGEGPLRPKLIQHPLGVAAVAGGLWVADSYNGKIKFIDGKSNTLATRIASVDGKPLSDPGGISVESDGSLLVADTGNDRILRLPPAPSQPLVVPVGRRPAAAEVAGQAIADGGSVGDLLPPTDLGTHRLAPGASDLRFHLLAPAGFEFSEGAPWSAEFQAEGALRIAAPLASGDATAGRKVEVRTRAELDGSDAKLSVRVHANICDAVNHAACYPIRARYAIRIVRGEAGAPIPLELAAPKTETRAR